MFLDNLFILLIYIGGLSTVLALGGLLADYLEKSETIECLNSFLSKNGSDPFALRFPVTDRVSSLRKSNPSESE